MLNAEGRALLRAVIERDAGLRPLVECGDFGAIAIAMNGYLPADMEIAPSDVYTAMRGHPGFAPVLNAEVLRDRIDGIPELYSARLHAADGGLIGLGAIQAITNELNLSPAEQVTHADVEAAMALRLAPMPTDIVQGTAALVGQSFVR